MRVVIIYRDKSDHARPVLSFLRDLEYRYPDRKVELIDIDTRDGMAMASLYDVTNYPCILVLSIEGSVLQFWQGQPLPMIDEVVSFAMSNQ